MHHIKREHQINPLNVYMQLMIHSYGFEKFYVSKNHFQFDFFFALSLFNVTDFFIRFHKMLHFKSATQIKKNVI